MNHPTLRGAEYQTEGDINRLGNQYKRIFELMTRDCEYRTLAEIAMLTQSPEASVSAQLRHIDRIERGKWGKDRRPTGGDRTIGLFEYAILPFNKLLELRAARMGKCPMPTRIKPFTGQGDLFHHIVRDAARREGVKGKYV